MVKKQSKFLLRVHWWIDYEDSPKRPINGKESISDLPAALHSVPCLPLGQPWPPTSLRQIQTWPSLKTLLQYPKDNHTFTAKIWLPHWWNSKNILNAHRCIKSTFPHSMGEGGLNEKQVMVNTSMVNPGHVQRTCFSLFFLPCEMWGLVQTS